MSNLTEEPPTFTRLDIKRLVSQLPTREKKKKSIMGKPMTENEWNKIGSDYPELKLNDVK